MVHGAPGLPSVSTSLRVTSMVPTNRCSATAAQATAGVWTKLDRRSLGPALGPAVDQRVSKSHVLKILHDQWANTNTTQLQFEKGMKQFLQTEKKNISKLKLVFYSARFFTIFSIRYQPRRSSTTCRTHHSTQCLPPASRNTPVVFPERQDRPHPARRLWYEEGWCQGCPPSPCTFLFVWYILFRLSVGEKQHEHVLIKT